jgi:hypothetical protein
MTGISRSQIHHLLNTWLDAAVVVRVERGRYVRVATSLPSRRPRSVVEVQTVEDLAARRDAFDRFWTYVDTSGHCWIWRGSATVRGYGHFRANGQYFLAHRWIYEREIGPIPHGMEIDHLCRTPPCVRPAHLEAVTHAENQRRAAEARWQQSVTGAADAGALSSSANKLPPQRAGVRGLLSAELLADNFEDIAQQPANNHGSDGE